MLCPAASLQNAHRVRTSESYLETVHQHVPGTSAVSLSGNPFSERTLKAHSRYGNQVRAAADAIDDPNLKAKALKVADVGTFLWLDTVAALGTLESYAQEVNCDEILGIVVQVCALLSPDLLQLTHDIRISRDVIALLQHLTPGSKSDATKLNTSIVSIGYLLDAQN